ncbi:MAG: signal peptidase II [Candidatus Woesearchaeota archaeon]
MDDGTRRRIITLPLITFALIVADQISKNVASGAGAYTLNRGISFGFLRGVENINEIMIVVASLALFLFIYLLVFRTEDPYTGAGFVLLISGTAGNLTDRLIYDGVIDFISIGRFPIFNFADSYLTIGVVLILLAPLIIRFVERRKNRADEPHEEPAQATKTRAKKT